MKKHILCLDGDGVGSELIDLSINLMHETKPYLKHEFVLEKVAFGGNAIDSYGHPFPEEVKEKLDITDAVLLGAVGHPKYDTCEIRPENGLLELRKHLGLFANVRSLKVDEYSSKYSPLKHEIISGTNIVIVRELIGSAYFGKKSLTNDYGADLMEYTREQIENIVHYAFKLAKKRANKLTSVDKANVLASSKLWRQIVNEISQSYPEVVVSHMYVDAMAMELIANPRNYDVVVMENLFGDILSDELAAIGGSLGLLPSGSFGHKVAVYEPAHGSAPTLVGLDLVNPIAMFLSVALMLRESFCEDDAANRIEHAIRSMIKDEIVTRDLSDKGVLTSQFVECFFQRVHIDSKTHY